MYAGFVARMELGYLPKYLLFDELPKDKGTPGGRLKYRVRYLGEAMKALVSNERIGQSLPRNGASGKLV